MTLKVSYINPITNRKEKREYKLAPGESESEAILFIYKALHFIFDQKVTMKIEERE